MAASTSKDQPPAYTDPDNQASTKPNYSKRASQLFRGTSQGDYTMSQYLELTFSVVVACNGVFEPVVIAIDENYDDLLHDIQHTLIRPHTKMMKVHWEKCWGEWMRDDRATSEVHNSNITAILRLLKSRNGVGCICIS